MASPERSEGGPGGFFRRGEPTGLVPKGAEGDPDAKI